MLGTGEGKLKLRVDTIEPSALVTAPYSATVASYAARRPSITGSSVGAFSHLQYTWCSFHHHASIDNDPCQTRKEDAPNRTSSPASFSATRCLNTLVSFGMSGCRRRHWTVEFISLKRCRKEVPIVVTTAPIYGCMQSVNNESSTSKVATCMHYTKAYFGFPWWECFDEQLWLETIMGNSYSYVYAQYISGMSPSAVSKLVLMLILRNDFPLFFAIRVGNLDEGVRHKTYANDKRFSASSSSRANSPHVKRAPSTAALVALPVGSDSSTGKSLGLALKFFLLAAPSAPTTWHSTISHFRCLIKYSSDAKR